MSVQETINELEKKRKEAHASFVVTLVFGAVFCLGAEGLLLYGGLDDSLDRVTSEVLMTMRFLSSTLRIFQGVKSGS